MYSIRSNLDRVLAIQSEVLHVLEHGLVHRPKFSDLRRQRLFDQLLESRIISADLDPLVADNLVDRDSLEWVRAEQAPNQVLALCRWKRTAGGQYGRQT